MLVENEVLERVAGERIDYVVMLSLDQFSRLQAVDKEWIGSEHYMGLAYFWNYEYRHSMRDADAFNRCLVHDAFLAAGLDLDGESEAHTAIVKRIVGI